MKKRVLLDVDGVVANYVDLAFSVARDMHGVFGKLRYEDLDQWDIDRYLYSKLPPGHEYFTAEFWSRMNEPGRIFNMNPYPGAVECVKKLMEISDLYFVTSPTENNATWASERFAWLQKHFRCSRYQIVITAAKHVVSGAVLVDDKLSNLHSWKLHNRGDALLFEQPYNKTDKWPSRVGSYDALIDYLDVALR